MYRNERLTKQLLQHIDRAEKMTLESMQDGRAEHEPTITDRLIGNLESRLDGADFAGVSWRAKTLTSIGAFSQETRHGADFFGVLNLRLPGYQVQKGFLAQAKRIEPGHSMALAEYDRLRRQCVNMNNRSPVSYVFIYSQMSGIRVVSANAVLAAPMNNPLDLTSWSLKEFFKAHFECLIGDFRVSAATPEELETLASDVRARNGLMISGSTNEDKIPRNQMR
jgi:hypothetical protein